MFAQAMLASEEVSNIIFQKGNFVLTNEITTMWGVMIVLVLLSYFATRKMEMKPKTWSLQNIFGVIIDFLMDTIEGIMGKENGRKYAPFLLTIFFLIICSNYVGLLPLAGHVEYGYKPPTSNLSVTAALAIITILAFFYYGIKSSPKKFAKFFFSPMLPLNLLDMVTRPLSLAVRLYGNIYGEEMVISFLFGMLPLFLPLPMYALSILFGAIQAYVFMMLATVYIEEGVSGH
ncbi:MAG: F0F1 ATP synthase subunit A [Peptococcaceae bacterium]|nr:F0F1 ATP synthase subunit A [Peptococcaceae bacterium]